MKNKFKKILTTTLVSAVSLSAIGGICNQTNILNVINDNTSKIASCLTNSNQTMASTPSNNIGKIVEASALANDFSTSIFNRNSNYNLERNILSQDDNSQLYVLSETPYISFSSDENSASFNMVVKFGTYNHENNFENLKTKLNALHLKKSILTIYVNELYNGNITLSDENKNSILNTLNTINSNTPSQTSTNSQEQQNRSTKIDSKISAIDSIVEVLENNLSPNSPYYQNKLSGSYQTIINNQNSTTASEHKELADQISNVLNLKLDGTSTSSIQQNITSSTNQTNNSQSENNTTDNNAVNDNSINVRNLNITSPSYEQPQSLNLQNQTNSIEYNNSSINSNTQPQTKTINNNSTNNQSTENQSQSNNSSEQLNTDRNSSRRTARRYRKSNRINYQEQQNNTNNSAIISSNNDTPNKAKSVTNMDNNHTNNNNIVRATRTPSSTSTEQYTSTKNSSFGNERAERVPYTTSTNFNQ